MEVGNRLNDDNTMKDFQSYELTEFVQKASNHRAGCVAKSSECLQ